MEAAASSEPAAAAVGGAGRAVEPAAPPGRRSITVPPPHPLCGPAAQQAWRSLLSDDDAGGSELHAACRAGDLAAVQAAIAAATAADVEASAAESAHPGAQLRATDALGRTPLHVAARYGYVDVVAALVQCALVLLDARDGSGCTPLWFASWEGHTEVVKLLVAEGVADRAGDLNTRSVPPFAYSPLIAAARRGHADTVRVLCDPALGHRVDLKCASEGSLGCALYACCQQGHVAVLDVFLSAPVRSRVDLNQRSANGETPLHVACFTGRAVIVERLLADDVVDDVEVGARNHEGATPLWMAACSDNEGNDACVRLLCAPELAHRVDCAAWRTADHKTPFKAAVDMGNMQVACTLSDISYRGRDVGASVATTDGETPLLCALRDLSSEAFGAGQSLVILSACLHALGRTPDAWVRAESQKWPLVALASSHFTTGVLAVAALLAYGADAAVAFETAAGGGERRTARDALTAALEAQDGEAGPLAPLLLALLSDAEALGGRRAVHRLLRSSANLELLQRIPAWQVVFMLPRITSAQASMVLTAERAAAFERREAGTAASERRAGAWHQVLSNLPRACFAEVLSQLSV